MRVLCVLGAHQYGNPALGAGTEYTAFIPALERLGHEVVHYETQDRRLFRDYVELNQALLQTVEDRRPDVMLSVQRDYEIWSETLDIIRARDDVATISWTTDDSWKYDQVSRYIGRHYHAMTTTYPEVVPKYRRDDIKHVLLTQWAANSHWLENPIPAAQCRYAVSFVGAAHGDRVKRIAQLRARGVDVACFGRGWPHGPIPADHIPHIIRHSAISLNFGNTRTGPKQIKARTFEVPGAGGFLLTERVPGLDRYYVEGQEIAVFDDGDDLAYKIAYYSGHPAERDMVARAGQERTRQEHTYEVRMREVLDFALKSKDSSHNKSGTRPDIQLEQAAGSHKLTPPLKALRGLLVTGGVAIWGGARGPRAARRLLFELSWRLAGARTYSAAGWPGRMFYNVS